MEWGMVARQPCVLTPADKAPASHSGKNFGDAMLLVPFESALGSALGPGHPLLCAGSQKAC